jgi:hypothetical protein
MYQHGSHETDFLEIGSADVYKNLSKMAVFLKIGQKYKQIYTKAQVVSNCSLHSDLLCAPTALKM